MKNKKTPIQHEEEYVKFLKKRLNSKNFQSNESKEEIEKTKKKYDKAKLKLKMMREGMWK
ncbi:MAG: hypothetical protein ACOCUI_00740 [bacterium]